MRSFRLFRRDAALPGAPMVSFVPRSLSATAFGDAPPDANLLLGHRFSLEGVGRLDGSWAALLAGDGLPARPVPRDLLKPGKIIPGAAELVVDWDEYWDEMAAMFSGVSRDTASIAAAARDAAAAVTYTARQQGGGLVLALRVHEESLRELGPWWRLGMQTKAARLVVNVTGLRIARPSATPAGGLGTSLADFSLGIPLFADAFGFATQVPSRRP